MQDAIAKAETTTDIEVRGGMRTQVSDARQETHVEACQYFREKAESIYKTLA
ncbi:hypothetical protein [Streptomyces sp. NPDC059631]|uniref:hypothetical protein n=1 Tax=unclassified Streptomyces TaxID=2593676 RepID=UPI0036A6C98A